jgi:PilZ domain
MDRRQHERCELEVPLRFFWKDFGAVRHRAEGVVRNISGRGVFISAHALPPLGAHVRFYLFFRNFHAGSRLVMRTTARVVRLESPTGANTLTGFAAVLETYTLRNKKEVVEVNVFNGRRRTANLSPRAFTLN